MFNNYFYEKPELIQCNVALPITGIIRGSSTEKLYQELICIPSAATVAQGTFFLFQNNKKPISQVPL